MEHKRPRLDSPEFADNLRYVRRSSAYTRRPTSGPITDVAKQPVRSLFAQTAPKPVPTVRLEPTLVAPEPIQEEARVPEPKVAASEPLEQQPAVTEAITSQPETKVRRRGLHMPSRRNTLLYGMAVIVFGAGIFVTINGMRANQQVAAQVKQGQKKTNATVADNVVPSTTKPSDAEVRSYAVSPNLPRYLDIPKLNIHTRTLSEGVTKGGELQVPWNIYDTGWYNASSQPGQQGAMLVDGHSGIGKLHGVFWKLGSLVNGDQIIITRGDGQKFTYAVTKVQTVDSDKVDMDSMLVSTDTNKPGLNLITCAGDIIPGTTELNKRVQVYAVLQ